MSRLLLSLLLTVTVVTIGCDSASEGDAQVKQRDGEPDVIQIAGNDPRMVAATAQARATALEFAKALAAPRPDELSVKLDGLSDWMYVENSVLVGGYTLRALRDSVSPEARGRLDAQVGFRFE